MLTELLGPSGQLPSRGRGKQGHQGIAVFSQHGPYADAVLRGRTYYAHSADEAPDASVDTAVPFTVYNPSGSGVNAVLLAGGIGYVSGTLGAGFQSWGVNIDKSAALPTGTAIVTVNALLGEGIGKCRAFETVTLPVAPTLVRVFCTLDASLATSVVGPWNVTDWVDGAIVVTPGTAVSIAGASAAGTAPLLRFWACWEEVPVE